ncbi:hypothetical protein [uncultured Kordia sp.]|uniref:hypothetical protein n=1 Tax=uncultured Kordia sp. TaxID=507699 RepID=UPI00262FF3D2|nr:hypothetical protein [uncultured Kordia sp.]
MKKIKKGIITLIISLGMSHYVSAQTDDSNTKNETTKFSIEIDPATFAFNGYSFHMRIQPKGCNHLLAGFGTYALDFPDALVNFNSKNKDKGWNISINQGYSVFGEHHFTKVNEKWFVGTQIGIQEFTLENGTILGNEKFTNLLAMVYAGYTLKPFKNKLYIKPWAGIGYTTKLSGSNTLGTSEYDIAPITMFVTVHIGYTF